MKGQKKMQKVAINLIDWLADADVIVTSPFVRARQTAEIISETLSQNIIIEAPELVPQSPPQAFLKWLGAHARNFNKVIVVGHEPHISSFISYLIAGVDHSIVEMKKSAVASLELEPNLGLAPGTARLNWLLPPKIVTN